MVMPGRIVQQIENIPQRPPTPPRESNNEGILKSTYVSRSFSKKSGTQTATQSPNLLPEHKSSGLERGHQKRVEWSEFLNSDEPSTPSGNSGPPAHHILRPLPSSDNKPSKSILKPYNGTNSSEKPQSVTRLSAPYTYSNFATMLESVVQQLAASDRNSRIDAYLSLSNVLKAAGNLPDIGALKDKIGLISQFIHRDMTAAKAGSGTTDNVIASHALTLLASLLWKPETAALFSLDFCAHVIDHATAAFETSITSKDVIKHLMFIITNQNFSAKVMTADRISRLLSALQLIEEHVQGRSIVVGRLSIYRRLLQQNKLAMLLDVGWVDHLFTDMISSFQDIRTPAITFGLEAALKLGTEKQTSRAVMELFKVEKGEEIKYADFYSSRLSAMVKKKQVPTMVPQIWTVVILFLRHRPHQIEQWEHMTQWLRVLQECFNCSDHEVKLQANIAWDRLVFAIKPDSTTRLPMVKMLLQPLNGQLRRRALGRNAKEARRSAIASTCNLLYYTMKPMASSDQLDLFWDEYVSTLIGSLLTSTSTSDPQTVQEDVTQACAILGSLFNANGPLIWSETRATEKEPVQAKELPGIDPRWIRRNVPRIFKVLGPVLEKSLLEFANPESPVRMVWSSFTSSIAIAGLKEIKVSNETMTFVAYFFNVISTIWHRGPAGYIGEGDLSSSFVEAFTYLTETAIKQLGVLPFTEKLLSISQEDTFTVVATPTHRPSKFIGDVRPPLQHLVTLVSQRTPGLEPCDKQLKMMEMLLGPFFETRKSKTGQIEFARDLCQLISSVGPQSSSAVAVWECISAYVQRVLTQGIPSDSSSSEQPLGARYRNVANVLETGAMLNCSTMSAAWQSLFLLVCKQATHDAGDSGRAISLIEPLAKTLSSQYQTSGRTLDVSYLVIMIDNASYPRERQALHAAQRRLWGTVITSQRTTSFDPFTNLYDYTCVSMKCSYAQLSVDHLDTSVKMCISLSELLRRCPTDHTADVLVSIQDGVAPWITDTEMKLRSRTVSAMFIAVANLWDAICLSLSSLPSTHSALLQKLEILFCAGFESKHKSIVNASIELWNDTFGMESDLIYPTKIEASLRRLRSVADLHLPSFPSDPKEVPIIQPQNYLEDSQNDDSFQYGPTSSSRAALNVSPAHPPFAKTRGGCSPARPSRKRRNQETPQSSSKRRTIKRDLTPKFRHNDSQVQFEAIVSSPLAIAQQESQILTARQREVRDRQQADAAMFPDLRSSPRAKSKTPVQASSTKKAESDSRLKPSTPDITKTNNGYDAYIASSPTPQRGPAEQVLDSDAMGPPSSPPEPLRSERASEHMNTSHVSTDYDSLQDRWNAPLTSPERVNNIVASKKAIDTAHNPSLSTLSIRRSSNTHQSMITEALPSVSMSRTPAPDAAHSEIAQNMGRTPTDSFVDALTSPLNLSPKPSNAASSRRRTDSVDGPTEGLISDERRGSFQLTDMDETSVLRLLDEVDEANKSVRATQFLSLPNMLGLHANKTTEFDDSEPVEFSFIRDQEKQANRSQSQDLPPTSDAVVDVERQQRRHMSTRRSMLAAESKSCFPETPVKVIIPVDSSKASVSGAPQASQNRRISARVMQRANSSTSNSSRLQNTRDEVSKIQEVSTGNGVAILDFTASPLTDPNQNEPLVGEPEPLSRKRGRLSKKEAEKKALEAQRLREEEEYRELEMRLQMSIEAQSQEQLAAEEVMASVEQPESGDEDDEVMESFDDDGDNDEGMTESDSGIPAIASVVLDEVDASIAATYAPVAIDATGNDVVSETSPAPGILAQLSALLQSLKGASLGRDEVDDIEDAMWDCKTELGIARERGKGV